MTNSSSSSYSVLYMWMNDGTYIYWVGGYDREDPIFKPPVNANEKLKALQDVDSLVEFLYECGRVAEAEGVFKEECDNFIQSVKEIESIDDIESLEMNFGLYYTDQGEDPDEGCTGFQLTYDFESGECDYRLEPTQDFIDDMNQRYG